MHGVIGIANPTEEQLWMLEKLREIYSELKVFGP